MKQGMRSTQFWIFASSCKSKCIYCLLCLYCVLYLFYDVNISRMGINIGKEKLANSAIISLHNLLAIIDRLENRVNMCRSMIGYFKKNKKWSTNFCQISESSDFIFIIIFLTYLTGFIHLFRMTVHYFRFLDGIIHFWHVELFKIN